MTKDYVGKVTQGNSLEVLKNLEDNSIDSIVTDPPYELSQDGKASANRVLFEFLFPKDGKLESSISGEIKLDFLLEQVFTLCFGRELPRKSSPVPIVSVALKQDIKAGEEIIKGKNKLPIEITNFNLGDCFDPKLTKDGCYGFFKLTDFAKAFEIFNAIGTGFFSGGIGIGFGISSTSFPSLFHRLAPIVLLDNDVGVFNNSLAQFVSTGGRAEDFFMTRFNLATGSIEFGSTYAALIFFALLQFSGAKFVTANPGAGGLPTEFQPTCIGTISDSANATLTLNSISHTVNIQSTGFMNKAWDGSKIAYNVDLWKECYRVLKPGGHILSFGATRTYHRMACAIEDAGFETRNCVNWIYMQGFSKGLNVSKAFDKKAGAEREVIGKGASQPAKSGHHGGLTANSIKYQEDKERYQPDITIPSTDKAKEWDGWHSDLKPSHELIYMGRKPLSEKTIVDNIEKWNTGALNIGESRVGNEKRINKGMSTKKPSSGGNFRDDNWEPKEVQTEAEGRFPSNTIIDGSPEVLQEMRKYGQRTSGSMKPHHKVGNKTGDGTLSNKILGTYKARPFVADKEKSTGTIDRFFKKCEFADEDIPAFLYYPKPSQAERNLGCEGLEKEVGHNRFDKCSTCGGTILQNPNRPSACTCDEPVRAKNVIKGNYHSTVKPVSLMEYLIILITPKNGIVLDPFAGSGTTLVAAEKNCFYWVGIDNSPDSIIISNARLKPFLNLNNMFDERQI